MRVYIGSDHAGYELKAHLLRELAAAGHDVVDVGPAEYDGDDDYPPYCVETARRAVAEHATALGVVLGGSGNGEQIAANKAPGCRAALAWNVETAQLAREHNDAHVVALGARMHSAEDATTIVSAFLATPFSGGERHARRIEMLESYERTGTPPALPQG